MILFILQNAYTSTKHPFITQDEWLRELFRSHTGRRLKEMVPDNQEYKVINSSPLIGNNPDSCFSADLNHIQTQISLIKPSIICACGKVAQDGCRKLNLKFVPAPHPAWRCLSKTITAEIKLKLT